MTPSPSDGYILYGCPLNWTTSWSFAIVFQFCEFPLEMAQGSWKSGAVADYGATTKATAPMLTEKGTVGEAVYPENPPAYTVSAGTEGVSI